MKNNDTLQSNTISLEEFIINVFTEEDRKYEAYIYKEKKELNKGNFMFTIGGVLFIVTFCWLAFTLLKIFSQTPPSNLSLFFTIIFSIVSMFILSVIIDVESPNFNNEIKKLASVYNHEDIMKLSNSNPHMHMLLLLKYILNTDKYSTMNIRTISDILLKNNIKHMVQEVDNHFTLTIYLNDTTYIIESNSLLCSDILKIPDNLILDVLELCNLDESFINYSWDEIVEYIEKMNQRDDERAVMNEINKLNNIDISK